jgi:rubredoxin
MKQTHLPMNTERYVSLAKDKFPHLDYSETKFESPLVKVRIKCPRHGIVLQDPYTHLRSNFGCPECGKIEKGKSRLRNRLLKLKDDVKIKHGDCYEYRWDTFNGRNEYMTIICSKHGEFKQIPSSHLNGRGCPICGASKRGMKRRLGKEECLYRFIANNGYKYDYSLISDDITYYDQIPVICPKHGIFQATVATHMKGVGCPKCQESHGEKKIRKLLTDWNVLFYSQYVFEGCVYKAPLRFDFFLPEYSVALEYQGRQHYIPYTPYGGQKEFEIIVIRDRIKKEYCLTNGIRFEEIRYDQNIKTRLADILVL